MATREAAKVAYRVSGIQELLLKLTAVVLDGVGFLLMLTVIGEVGTEVIGLTGDALFFIWFWMLGAKFLTGQAGRKIVTLAGNALVEAVPFANGVYPGFSIAVWRLVKIMKEEDEEEARNAARKARQEDEARIRRVQAILAERARRQAANTNTQEPERQAA